MILFAFMKIELWIDRWIDLQYKHDIIGFMRVDREARPKASRLRICVQDAIFILVVWCLS